MWSWNQQNKWDAGDGDNGLERGRKWLKQNDLGLGAVVVKGGIMKGDDVWAHCKQLTQEEQERKVAERQEGCKGPDGNKLGVLENQKRFYSGYVFMKE